MQHHFKTTVLLALAALLTIAAYVALDAGPSKEVDVPGRQGVGGSAIDPAGDSSMGQMANSPDDASKDDAPDVEEQVVQESTKDVSVPGCSDAAAGLILTWPPLEGADAQWVDLSLEDNDFELDTFDSRGPLDDGVGSLSWPGLEAGVSYYWRVNALTSDGWFPSTTQTFETCAPSPSASSSVAVGFPYEIEPAISQPFPMQVDSNSPLFWDGDQVYVFNSTNQGSYRSSGYSLDELGDPQPVLLPRPERPGSVWIEAVWRDPGDGALYGWYHFEPTDLPCYTAPIIGAAVSYDDGLSWEDRGFAIENGFGIDCDDDNGYFSGGAGDLSVVLSPAGDYFYFFFSSYAGPAEQQGIGIARSPFAERGRPGTLTNYYDGAWSQPSLDGLMTPMFATATGWHGPYIDAYWGASVHWNTYLQSYVALINRSAGERFMQEGSYISFSQDLLHWTEPEKIIEGGSWYPEAVGLEAGETDSLAAARLRLYNGDYSDWLLIFQ